MAIKTTESCEVMVSQIQKRERERETDRQIDRHADIQTDTQTDTQTERERERERERDRQTDRQRNFYLSCYFNLNAVAVCILYSDRFPVDLKFFPHEILIVNLLRN